LYGNGRNRTALATLKMLVLAPMPEPIVITAAASKARLERSVLAA